MGVCSSIKKEYIDRDTYHLINQIHLKDVVECYDYFQSTIKPEEMKEMDEEMESGTDIAITLQQFDDVFSPILNNTKHFFSKLNINGKLIFTEAASVLALFCKGLLDEKLSFLCAIFDDNGDGFLQKNEVLGFFQNIGRAIWRVLLTGPIMIPSYSEIEKFIKENFKHLTNSKKKFITFKDMTSFIKQCEEIQDLLYVITEYQTFERAKKRYDNIMESFDKIFNKEVLVFMEEKYSPTRLILQGCKISFGSSLTDSILEEMRALLDPLEREVVSEYDYYSVIKPLGSFLATDVNGDNELDTTEVKTLLWLIEGEEPTDTRVEHDVGMIDNDGSGTIDKLEWIKYLGSSGGSGVVDFSIKKSFDCYDKDKNGKIDCDEFSLLLKDNILEPALTAGKSHDSLNLIDAMINALSYEIMKLLDTSNKGYLEWVDFKNYMTITQEKQEKLKKFIESCN